MSSPAQGHPEHLDLLRYLDGELKGGEARRVKRHLETCWECRTEVEEMEKTIGECVRYRKNVIHTCLPTPPAPWMDIYAAFSRIDSTPGRVSFWQSLLAGLRQGGKWAVPAAAVAVLLLAVFFKFRETPSVQA